MFVIDFEQVNAPQRSVQCHYTKAFKYLKSATKTLGKSVKSVQGEIIQRKMSGGMGGGGGIPWGQILRGVIIVQRGTI